MKIVLAIQRSVIFIIIASCSFNNSPVPKDIKTSIVFGGDIAFGDSYHLPEGEGEDSYIIFREGYMHSFEKMKPVLNSAHYRIANLETPIDTNHAINRLAKIKRYLHWCDPKQAMAVIEELGFDIISLANNHTLDQGEQGLKSTINHLSASNIGYFGAGLNIGEAEKPIVIDTTQNLKNIYLLGAFELNETYDKRYKFYAGIKKSGVNPIQLERLRVQIQNIQENDPFAYIIFYPHWGGNYKWASQGQKDLAKQLIDLGVDLIIGHGAHTIQEIESYKNKMILFNIGNLVMNSPGRYRSTRALPYSFIPRLDLERIKGRYKTKLKIYPILSDNRKMNYQPRLINKQEMDFVLKTINEKSESLNGRIIGSQDSLGLYLSIDLPQK